MSKQQKYLAGLVAVCALFFFFVFIRVNVAKPNDDSVKLAAISRENYAHLGKAAYKDAYPLEYESYMKNNRVDPSPTGYGGSMPENSYLIIEPEIMENFKGYKFSAQYDVARGHTWAGVDQINSKRIGPQKGNCIACKGSWMYDKWYKESGWEFASKPFAEVTPPYTNKDTVEGTDLYFGCSSCHDPETMNLRVYQQGFVDAMARVGVDVNNAPHNDKRAYVCGQCHNEYYFMAEDGRVNHPFDNGWNPEQEYQFYQSGQAGAFKQDWIHPDSKAPMLKAQHPDFEIWIDSVHGENGVTCVDCHMPYMRSNGKKYTSHWMTSPLKTTEQSCLKCHDESAEKLINRVKIIHDNNFKLQRLAGMTVAQAHLTVQAAMAAGATDEQLAGVRLKLREAQFYWDWISAENGNGFHNPDKCMRTSGLSINLAHQVIEETNALMKGTVLTLPAQLPPAPEGTKAYINGQWTN